MRESSLIFSEPLLAEEGLITLVDFLLWVVTPSIKMVINSSEFNPIAGFIDMKFLEFTVYFEKT